MITVSTRPIYTKSCVFLSKMIHKIALGTKASHKISAHVIFKQFKNIHEHFFESIEEA